MKQPALLPTGRPDRALSPPGWGATTPQDAGADVLGDDHPGLGRRRLEHAPVIGPAQLGPTEEVGIAAITASELLHGVHRATPEHRARRDAFVEGVLAAFPPLAFDLLAARARAALGRAGLGRDRRRGARPARRGHRHHRWMARRNSQYPLLRAHSWLGRCGHQHDKLTSDRLSTCRGFKGGPSRHAPPGLAASTPSGRSSAPSARRG